MLFRERTFYRENGNMNVHANNKKKRNTNLTEMFASTKSELLSGNQNRVPDGRSGIRSPRTTGTGPRVKITRVVHLGCSVF